MNIKDIYNKHSDSKIIDYSNSADLPDNDFDILVENDVRIAYSDGWTSENVYDYLENILDGLEPPFFITNFSDATGPQEEVLMDSDDMEIFMKSNYEGIKSSLGWLAGDDPLTNILLAYVKKFKDKFYEQMS